ncbi:hypothetical protein SRS16CHR_00990 [Variovorax sp. SRS16]|uniref:hypothetical protein n=1 Tax=Variovorax sp. SRS16 TaxID=282217 RepID=UPI001319731E|nr:hypothetical protein [Variovorax sp. SRS16]VTU14233.1 hypothetical protein SRS16CHR_00990 [Variovorax sp. SRS16]
MGLLDVLQQVVGGNAEKHFDEVAQNASPDQLGAGLAAAMRSDQTPPFSQMVGHLFGQSSASQQAGVLNQILATLGPAALSAAAGGALGRVLPPGQTQLTPDQASQLSPAQVTEIAAHAEQAHPGVVDQVSQFYAQHAGLIKVLGGAALAVTLAKMKEHATQG